jgi:hypothetical protein
MEARSRSEAEIAGEFPPDPPEIWFDVGDIFRKYGADYRAEHNSTGPQLKAMAAIEKRRSTALGGHVDECEHCGHREISYNSCRNRNCPKCRASQRSAWVDARELELLPIQYFHFVFTLAHTLLPLARNNPDLLYGLLFRIAAETLQSFARNRWGGKLGIIMVLHTWGQTLNSHPHVHCIVAGGALKDDGSAFVHAPKNFLFPVRALSRAFREKEEKIAKTLHLSAEEFLRHFLSHILPPQFRRIRDYGFLVNSQRKEKLTACRALLGFVDPPRPYIAGLEAFLEGRGIDYSLCPSCGEGKMCCVYSLLSFHDPPQCFLEAASDESLAIRVQPRRNGHAPV